MSKHSQIKTIYDEAHRHLGDWFPKLPSYPGFVQRLTERPPAKSWWVLAPGAED